MKKSYIAPALVEYGNVVTLTCCDDPKVPTQCKDKKNDKHDWKCAS